MNYRPEIDGLRAIAVVPVILFHAGLQAFGGGYVGVDVFFVISGYLITSIIVGSLAEGRFSLKTFYERRMRRILPALYLVVALSAVAAWFILLPHEMMAFARSLIAVPLFVSNILFRRETGYFDDAAELKPLLHTWSLAVEEQYYLFTPLLLMAVWRFAPRRLLLVLAIGLVASLLLALVGSVLRPVHAFFLLPTRAWELLAGAMLAVWHHRHGVQALRPGLADAGTAIGLALIAVSVFAYDAYTPFPSAYTLAPVLGTVLVIHLARGGTLTGRLLAHPWVLGIGLISYSAYLWHQPLIAFARHVTGPGHGTWPIVAIAMLTWPLAWLSWRFVENPWRRPGARSARAVASLAVLGAMVLVGLGWAGVATSGFLDRYQGVHRDNLQAYLTSPTYVTGAFKAREHRAFGDDSGRQRLLIVGDSYAQDLVNAVLASPLGNQYQIVTHTIPFQCGVIWEDVAAVPVPRQYLKACRDEQRFQDAALQAKLRAADAVWLAAKWQDWQLAHLERTLRAIEGFAPGASLRVFGRKDWGSVDYRDFVSLDASSLSSVVVDPRTKIPDLASIDARVAAIAGARHVAVRSVFCVADWQCSLFDPSGRMFSYDGAHLTPVGAARFGERLEGLLRGP